MHPERRLTPSPFPGDDGTASVETRRCLEEAARSSEPTRYLRAIAALCVDRLLVPVVATATRLGESVGGLVSDKEAEMAVVLMRADDGRRALLAFTGLDSLRAWQPAGRPVPVTLDVAAKTTLSEGCTALLIDLAGPHRLTIEPPLLDELAAGHRLVELGPEEFGWAVPRC